MRFKKASLGLLVSIFLFVQLVGDFAIVKPVHAQMDAGITAAFTGKWSWEQVGKALEGAALGALVQGASYFMRKLAYDTATYVASGGKGQGALAFKQGPGSYFKSVALDSAAEAINNFAGGFGLKICQPANMQVSINIALGLRQLYTDDAKNGRSSNGPSPECNWQSLKNGAASHWDTVSDPSKMFTKNFTVNGTDFGIALGAMGKIDRLQSSAVTAAQSERTEGQGFKSVTGLISGNVKTPSQVVQEETKAVTSKQQGEMSMGQIAGIYGSGALQIIPMAGSVFVNTLVSQLMNNVLKKGLLPDRPDAVSGGSNDSVASFTASNILDNRQAVQNAFNFIMTVIPKKQMNSFPVAETFASCESGSIGINNCVIDTNFQGMLEEASRGDQPLTIKMALEKGLLPDRPLISPRRIVDNQDIQNCSHEGYCYSNVQKLRKARILPLGFEIATLKADPDRPQDWLLSKVVGDGKNTGFYDCPKPKNGEEIIPDAAHPFCHLIDPNWIIKVPETRCAAEIFGDQLVSNTSERLSECVDWQSCIKEDQNGQCQSYGYCTREKNVWKFTASGCYEQYATCKTFVNRAGAKTSYLERSVDYGECTTESLGCRAYSTEKTFAGGAPEATSTWVASVDSKGVDYKKAGRNQTLYFNEKISNYSCSQLDNGCTAFYKSGLVTDPLTGFTTFANTYQDKNLIYLKKAPDYLGCYDTQQSDTDLTINWPQTKADLNNLATPRAECANFAQACLPEEVGCEAYTPKTDSGAPTVPGIVGENYCSAQCVGYDTYKQSKTNFGPAVYPLYFVPSLGKTCQPSYQGCSEFVNLDTKEKGGEGLEYYYKIKRCEKPNILNQAVFYTWEGSSKEGYVLRVHKLKTINDDIYQTDVNGITDGWFTSNKFTYTKTQAVKEFATNTPALVNTDREHIDFAEAENYAYNYALCNQQKYNLRLHEPYNPEAAGPDCRAFYDRAGNIYYRLLSNTVTVDAACHPLRKTETDLRVDDSIHNENDCKIAKGVWGKVSGSANDVCQRCYGGGEYGGGYCIYNTIASESNSCPATANGCREYVGNTGNKIKTVFLDEFEPQDNTAEAYTVAKNNWQGGASQQVVAESVQVGLHSLKNDVDTVSRQLATSTLKNGSWYQISFWARGAVQSLEVQLSYQKDGATQILSFGPAVGIGDAWREYKVGPIQFSDSQTEPAQLLFKRVLTPGNLGPYFIDSVRLTELQDRVFLLKESWKTKEGYDAPLACDADYTDPLPGRALGCKAYNNSDAQDVYLTGFEKLCRDRAVGCTPMFDTYNTLGSDDAKQMQIYNAWCDLGAITLENKKCSLSLGTNNYECNVEVGKNGCYLFGPLVVDSSSKIQSGLVTSTAVITNRYNVYVVTSTLVIPADTSSTAPIYLTNYKTYRCAENNLGCTKSGAEDQLVPMATTSAFAHADNYLVNNPANYKDTLCRADLVGCEQYSTGDNTYFFRDPLKNGNSLCYYKPASTDSAVSGWLMQGVGKCNKNINLLCKSDAECGADDTCKIDGNGSVPCYENYTLSGGEYGLHSNGDLQYGNKVGVCPSEQNSCTEFIDPFAKTTINPKGEPYYVLTADSQFESCSQVSQQLGCILFNQTDNPKLMYDSAATYEASQKNNNQPVSPVVTASNDTNVLLQVKGDRQCSEWLSCKTSYNFTSKDNKTTEACYQLGRCVGTEPKKSCTVWAPSENKILNKLLTEAEYVNRDISWSGEDYSGYSLYNKYAMDTYSTMVLGTGQDSKEYIVYKDKEYQESCKGASEGQSCGVYNDQGQVGKCFNGNCVYTIDQRLFTPTTLGVAAQCKVRPEKDTPFRPDIVKGDKNIDGEKDYIKSADGKEKRLNLSIKSASYGNANYCQSLDDCSCSYKKIYYKNSVEKDYFSPTAPVPWQGVSSDGKPCQTGALDCNKIDKIETYLGSMGFCLEFDLSRPLPGLPGRYPCLTWLPLDVSGSGIDIYNNNPEAGYYPALDAENGLGQVYCTQSTANGLHTRDEDYFIKLPSTTDNGMNESDGSYGGFWSGVDYVNSWYDPDYPDERRFGHEDLVTRHNYGWYYFMKGPAKVSDNFYDSYSNSADLMKILYSTTELWAANELDLGNSDNSMVWYVRNPYHYGEIIDKRTYISSEYRLNINNNLSAYNLDVPIIKNQIRAIHFSELILPAVVDYPCEYPGTFDEKECHGFSNDHNYRFRFVDSFGLNGVSDKIQINISELDKLALSSETNIAFGDRVMLKDSYFYLDDNAKEAFWSGSKDPATSDYTPLYLYPFKGIDKDENTVYGFIILLDNKFDEKNIQGQSGSADDTTLSDFTLKEEVESYVNSILNNQNGDEISDEKKIENIRAFVRFDKKGNLVKYDNSNGEKLVPNEEVQWQATYDYWPDTWGGKNDGRLSGIPISNRQPGNYLNLINTMHGPEFAAVIEFEPRCTEFTAVVGVDGVNKAYTDKIRQDSIQYPNCSPGSSCPFNRTTNFTPFGSINLTTFDLDNSNNKILFDYTFKDYDYDGLPYDCRSPVWLNFDYQQVNYGDYLECSALYRAYNQDSRLIMMALSSGNTSNGHVVLKNLFTKAFNVVVQKNNESFGQKSPSYWDVSKDMNGTMLPPQIYSLNPTACFQEDKHCTVGELNNFSVNQKTGVKNSDYNKDGVIGASELAQGDPLFGNGNFTATANFFAFADHQKMPLRRVMIDWGDGYIQNIDVNGKYKNRKPYCESDDKFVGECYDNSDSKYTGLSCHTSTDCLNNQSCTSYKGHFGNQDRACQEGYFEFAHTYFCTADLGTDIYKQISSLSPADTQAYLYKKGLMPDDYVCVFQPKVQVQDNWGWCNGVTDIASKNVTTTGYYGGNSSIDACGGAGQPACDCNINGTNKDKAWAYYKGQIIVVPTE